MSEGIPKNELVMGVERNPLNPQEPIIVIQTAGRCEMTLAAAEEMLGHLAGLIRPFREKPWSVRRRARR